MEDTLIIGKIVKPQGIKGDLKVLPLTDDFSRFSKLKNVLIEEKTYRVVCCKNAGDAVIVSISGIEDRNTAETFRGMFLRVKREDAVKLKENQFFIADLVGCKFLSFLDGKTREIGRVEDVISCKVDIISVRLNNGKNMSFPFLKDVIYNIDVENGTFIVNEKKLEEIALYED